MLFLLACSAPTETGKPDDTFGAGETGDSPIPEEETVDVVIIGGGPAGLAAAIEASLAGADTILLEREGSVGGSAMWASGLMLFCGTPEQAAIGVSDSPETLLAEWPDITGGDPTDAWVQYWAYNNVPLVHDWLDGLGISFYEPMPDPSAGLLARVHEIMGGGPDLITALSSQIPSGVIRTDAEATGLSPTGVEWVDLSTGDAHHIEAGAIVVATGGFMHDLDRVRAAVPDLELETVLYDSWPGADGNGLDLLGALGASTENLGAVGLYAHAMADPDGSNDAVPINFAPIGMWVDVDGARFTDEHDINSFENGRLLAELPGGMAWVIIDADTAEFGVGVLGFGNTYTIDELLASGDALDAEDLETLGDLIGVDPLLFAGSVEELNAYALEGADDPYREPGMPADGLDHAPYYAVAMYPSAAKGFGGVDVDLSGRVIDTDGVAVEHVYAAGELAGMAGGSLVGDYGFTGSMSAVLLGGRVAGQAAAADALAD